MAPKLGRLKQAGFGVPGLGKRTFVVPGGCHLPILSFSSNGA